MSSKSAQSNLRPASSCLRGVVWSTTVPLRIALSRCMAASSKDSCTDFIIAWVGCNLCSPITYTCTPGSTKGQIVACIQTNILLLHTWRARYIADTDFLTRSVVFSRSNASSSFSCPILTNSSVAFAMTRCALSMLPLWTSQSQMTISPLLI